VRCSILVITLITSIRFTHITPIQKALFGVHVMATKLCSMRLVSSPKFAIFISKNLILDFFSIYGNFSFIV